MFKSPSQQRIFEPQAVAHIKTGYKSSLYYAKPGQIPQYGANISGQIRVKFPRMSRGGGVVGQHIDTVNVLIIEPVKNNYFSRNNVPKKRPRLVL